MNGGASHVDAAVVAGGDTAADHMNAQPAVEDTHADQLASVHPAGDFTAGHNHCGKLPAAVAVEPHTAERGGSAWPGDVQVGDQVSADVEPVNAVVAGVGEGGVAGAPGSDDDWVDFGAQPGECQLTVTECVAAFKQDGVTRVDGEGVAAPDSKKRGLRCAPVVGVVTIVCYVVGDADVAVQVGRENHRYCWVQLGAGGDAGGDSPAGAQLKIEDSGAGQHIHAGNISVAGEQPAERLGAAAVAGGNGYFARSG